MTDNAGVSKVEFLVDDKLVYTFDYTTQAGKSVPLLMSRSLLFSWKSDKTGLRVLKLVAYDAANNAGRTMAMVWFTK